MSGASNFVQGVDLTFIIILGISVFFLIGITAVMIYFVFRYSRKKNPKATNIEGNNTLEIVWTAIPLILVLIMFYFGWVGFRPMRHVPEGAIQVKAIGQMWSWSFEYENGKKSGELIVPLNKPVKLNLFSRDVIHSLYIPAFRIKEDVVPGKNNYLWFTAQQEGEYDIFCAEMCGDRHSYMLSKVKVMPEDEYNSWLSQSDIPAGEHPGLTIMKQNACISCHSRDGSKIVGPTFKGLFGRKEIVVENGVEKEVNVDEDYIKRSIYEPNAQVVKGFNQGLMTPYKDKLTDEDVEKIIEYIKGL
jgi:cytochrome c oxidase subunit II